MQDATEKNLDLEVPLNKKLDDLYELIDGIEICMFTTRRRDGYLVSRAMGVQKRENGSDLWFVTDIETDKLDELEQDPHVNVAFYRDGTREWVSVSGTARISRNRDEIRRLYKSSWSIWFPDEGGARNGSVEDPRITLIHVDAHSVSYFKKDRPAPAVLFELAKARLSGRAPKLGDLREVSSGELERDRAR
ncbi:MAG: pyridoxamine 5'-phosphate oxidase family protein [Anaerolineae bacterium]|nr:pyridoxamine 5'-phosphate oxidase family protein [Gemmatimonadaceae bacterium]